jgi:hypothetical protein
MTVLSSQDVKELLNVNKRNDTVNEQIGNDLVDQLVVAAECCRLKLRFMDAIANKRSTKFQIYQVYAEAQGVNLRDIIHDHNVLERFEKQCGLYVHASYWTDEDNNLNFTVEFIPPQEEPPTGGEPDDGERVYQRETTW